MLKEIWLAGVIPFWLLWGFIIFFRVEADDGIEWSVALLHAIVEGFIRAVVWPITALIGAFTLVNLWRRP